MSLGFRVTKKQAEKKDGHNGVILPEIQAKIEGAALAYHQQHNPHINMHEARAWAYTAFWRAWRECK